MTVDAPALARIFFDTVFKHHGVPSTIISDRDPRFMSSFWRSLFSLTGTRLGVSTAYHPQTDGQSERTNRTLEDMLRAYTSHRQTDWDLHLTAAEFAYNDSAQASTRQTPFFLTYGQHPRTPASLLQPTQEATNQATHDFLTTLRHSLDITKTFLRQAQQRQASAADRTRRHVEFQVGNRVLLSTVNLNLQDIGPARKLLPKFIGPFPILECISTVAYKLRLPATMRIHPVFHVSLLRPYRASDRDDEARPPPLEIDGEPQYEVEQLLEMRAIKRGRATKREYLVKWRGYPYYEATWEPEANLIDLDAYAAYHASRTPHS